MASELCNCPPQQQCNHRCDLALSTQQSIYTLTDFTLYVLGRYWYIFLSCVGFQVLIHMMADFSRKLTAEISSICRVIDSMDDAIIVSLRLNSYQDISICVTYVLFSHFRGNLQ